MGESSVSSFYIDKVNKTILIPNCIEIMQKEGVIFQGPLRQNKNVLISFNSEGEWKDENCPIEEAIKKLSNTTHGDISFWFKGYYFLIGFLQKERKKEYAFFEKIWIGSAKDRFFFDDRWEDRLQSFVNIHKRLYKQFHPFYAWSDNTYEMAEYELKFTTGMKYEGSIDLLYESAKNNKILRIWWLNFFGPKLVETLGKKKLLSAPSYITEELQDGGIMLVRSPNPFTIDEPYIKAEEIEKYLGITSSKEEL